MIIIPSVFATKEKEYNERLKIASSISNRVHIDVMDGKFVGNKSPDLGKLKKINGAKIEVHLMVENPSKYLKDVKKLEAKRVYIHLEAFGTAKELLECVYTFKDSGLEVGIAISPQTASSQLDNVLDAIDAVLIMSVEPGKEGQHFLRSAFLKLAHIRKLTKKEIGVDGGVDKTIIPVLEHHKASFAVVGSAIFS